MYGVTCHVSCGTFRWHPQRSVRHLAVPPRGRPSATYRGIRCCTPRRHITGGLRHPSVSAPLDVPFVSIPVMIRLISFCICWEAHVTVYAFRSVCRYVCLSVNMATCDYVRRYMCFCMFVCVCAGQCVYVGVYAIRHVCMYTRVWVDRLVRAYVRHHKHQADVWLTQLQQAPCIHNEHTTCTAGELAAQPNTRYVYDRNM